MSHAELEVVSNPAQLASIRAFVRAFCHKTVLPTLDEESIDQLELAVNEAASNIIRHAHGGRTDAQIKIEADGYPNHISVLLEYGGESFDVRMVPPPAFDGSREGGFGVYLIEQCVDEVRYSQDSQGRNYLYLKKNREEGGGKREEKS